MRATAGFAIGGSIGFVLGTLVGFSRVAEAAIDRSVQMVRAIPFLAVLPLVIVWLGVGEAEKMFLVALGVSFPIYINTTLGIRQVDPKLIELGRVQGLGSLELIRRIVLPGALPSILTGVRYALASAWLALVVAETIGAQSGIGFLAMDAREFLRTDVIVLTIVIYALIGVAADAIARLLERRLLAWHSNFGGGPMTLHVAPPSPSAAATSPAVIVSNLRRAYGSPRRDQQAQPAHRTRRVRRAAW